MTRNWQIMMMMTGCLITSSMVCIAQQDKMSMNQFEMEGVAPFTTQRTAYAVLPSQNFQEMFNHIYPQDNHQTLMGSWKAYGEQLRSKFALQWGNYFQVSFNKIKSGALKPQKSEIVDVNTHLSSRMSAENVSAHGYGVEVKVKLD